MNVALLIIGAFLVFAFGVGVLARWRRRMNLEQWAVGGRGFGALLTFVLVAGDCFTIYSFLGASGWAYSRGVPTFYYLGSGALAFLIGYWTLPPLWRYAKENQLVSFSDFFAKKYDSRAFGIVVAVVALLGLLSFLIIQLRGLGIIVSEASYGAISPSAAIWLSALAMMAFMIISGIRGSAWIAVVKDGAALVIAVFLGIYLPIHYYGSIGKMFEFIQASRPDLLRLPENGLNLSWYNSTMLLVALGYFLFPFLFTSFYAAKSESAIRRNAIAMPLYLMLVALIYLAGYAAVRVIPNLQGADSDLAMLRLAKMTFNPWFVGIIGGTGLLTVIVPASMILLTASVLISKNIYQDGFNPAASDSRVTLIARLALPVYGLIGVYFVLKGASTIVALAIFSSGLLTQLFPAFIFSLPKRRIGSKGSACAGIVVGIFVLAYVTIGYDGDVAKAFAGGPAWLQSMNAGMIALIANTATFVLVALLKPRFVDFRQKLTN